MGKSGGATHAAKQASKAQAAQSSELFNLNRPARQGLNQQMLEVLQTGGSNARLPITQNIVESAGRASSNAMRQDVNNLAVNRLAQTPFGIQSQAALRGTGARDLTNAATQVPRSIAAAAPAIIQGQAGIAASQGAAAAQGQAQRAAAESQQNAQTTSTIAGGAGALVGIGAAVAIAI